MPRACSICHHLQRHAIDEALTAGEAFRNIAQRFGTSVTALHRHKHEHLMGRLAHAQQPQHTASDTPQPPTDLDLPAEAARVFREYRAMAREVESLRVRNAQGWCYLMDHPLVRRLEGLRQQCLSWGIAPERLAQEMRHDGPHKS